MHLIVCIEDKDGLSFCGKRLSFDREVTGHILQMCSGSNLWMNQYSSSLFPDVPVIVDEAFMEKAGEGDYCFLENIPLLPHIPNIESIIVYHWNRRYPSTVKFPVEILEGRQIVQRAEFSGYSHDKITMERYQ